MKNKIQNGLAAVTMAMSIFAVSSLVEAYTNCRTIPGHYVNGVWHHSHRVCSGYNHRGYNHRCHWVEGHRWNGHWYPAHKVCR